MLGVGDEDPTFFIEEKQATYTHYDDESLESEDYRLGFENSIMQVHEQYDLISKKIPETPKPKASEISIKKRSENIVKEVAKNNKTVVESSGKGKGKSTQTTDKPCQEPNSTSIVANAPDKTVSTDVHSGNQQVDFAHKTVTKK